MIRLHNANEHILFHCQEVGAELKGYLEEFQLRDQVSPGRMNEDLIEVNKRTGNDESAQLIKEKLILARSTQEKQAQQLTYFKHKKNKSVKDLESHDLANKIEIERRELKGLQREANLKQ